jgi:hypothetical protein
MEKLERLLRTIKFKAKEAEAPVVTTRSASRRFEVGQLKIEKLTQNKRKDYHRILLSESPLSDANYCCRTGDEYELRRSLLKDETRHIDERDFSNGRTVRFVVVDHRGEFRK